MTSRTRTTSGSRRDYGYWRPSDSDSDRPRQTMATTQRHNVDQIGVAEAPRKHHSSRRVDPADLLDASAAYSRHRHKSSSKDRSSTAHQSYYPVPPSPNPSVQYQTQDAYYDLRAYLKKKTDKRSPQSSKEKELAGDEVKASRFGLHERHAYPTTTAYAQPTVSSQAYPAQSTHATRDPTSSSRHHRERDRDREKTSSRDPERARTRDPTRDTTTEKREDREKRRRREGGDEKERSSKDKERRREKDKHKDREGRAAADVQPTEAASVYQAYAQSITAPQRSADRIPAPYPEYTRPPSTQPQVTAHVPAAMPGAVPWAGLTSAGRGAVAPVQEPTYPYASDKEDPPLPIPPPGRRRERTSSKPHRSHHHKVSSQQPGQDSGISSSEQEHERPRTVDRADRQASILQRGNSSGPSGSENEKTPTIQNERRKHRTHGESSRHQLKSASVDAQPAPGPTTSQEIASAWYQTHQREPSGSKASVDPSTQKLPSGVPATAVPAHTLVPPSGKPTLSVGLTASQRYTPQIVSIRAGQGPADPQATLPKIHSGVTPLRQTDPLPPQQYQPSVRHQESSVQATPSQGHANAYLEAIPVDHHSSVSVGASGPYQQALQAYSSTPSHSRHPDRVTPGVTHGSQQAIPDVVVRPPTTAPAPLDPYSGRTATTLAQPIPTSGQSSGRLQIPPVESRSRSTPTPVAQSAAYAQASAQPPTHPLARDGGGDAYRADVAMHAKAPSQDLSSRFPVYEDTAATRPSVSGASQPSSASPKRGLTYPGASAPAHPNTVHVNPSNYLGVGSYDPRSPKPPSVTTITNDAAASRLQSHSSGSPAVVAHAVSAGSSSNTPKHSPSIRLPSHRNGSNDTIVHAAPTKPSPSGSSQQQLPHRPSAVNLQPHASSRQDHATISRQLQAHTSSAYPEQIRYRSPAPQVQGYPNVQASSSVPSVVAPVQHSQAYSTQTPITSNDYQYGRTAAAASQAPYPAQYASVAPGQSRSGQPVDYSLLRSPDPTHTVFQSSSTVLPSGQRGPPRTAPSPAPTVRPPRLNTVSSPSKVPPPLQSAPLPPTRNQTFPVPSLNHSTTTPFPTTHSRTASDPQYGASRYASASLPTRGQGYSRAAAAATTPQADVLLTPSSLAPSMLPQPTPTVPLSCTTSKNTIKEREKEGKKKGFFGISLFRSRSSPPKDREVSAPPPSAAIREKRERNVSQPTRPAAYMQAVNHIAPSPATAPQVAVAATVSIPTTQQMRGQSTNGIPSATPIAAPTPISVAGQRNPNGKMFTPFRLLSRRHRTVSAASVEAVDGTVINAMLTGGDSTRSSTAGRPSPPLRDPMMAAQEWRNKEEYETQTRGPRRRRRPGVTFDIGDEVPEDGRPSLQKSMRANAQSLQAAQAQAQPQSYSQAHGSVHSQMHHLPARQATA